jgi:hypothetical protein
MSGDDPQQCPESFYCPITGEVMEEPVIDNDGISYEKKAIITWLQKSQVSPMTRNPLKITDLKPNRALKGSIDALKNETVQRENMPKFKPGDWVCYKCGKHNFANRTACFGCFLPAIKQRRISPGLTGDDPGSSSSPSSTPSLSTEKREWSWKCSKCSMRNTTIRRNCIRCFSDYSVGGSSEEVPVVLGIVKQGDWFCTCGKHNFATRIMCVKCGKFPKKSSSSSHIPRPGDWTCKRCDTNNFASRDSCFHCRQSRTQGNDAILESLL